MSDSIKKKAGRGLGKGLGALMEVGALDPQPDAGHAIAKEPSTGPRDEILFLDPTKIHPNPKQPRRVFDEESLGELAESVKRTGIQEPLIVRRVNDEFQMVCGERRCRAAIMAGLEHVPALVRDIADGDMLMYGLIENIQREDLNAIELAYAYKELMENYGWTQDQVAEQIGKKRATVANTLRLLQLPEVIQEQVADGSLTMGHARALAGLSNTNRQLALARKIIDQGLSVRQAEKLAAEESAGPKRHRKQHAQKPPYIIELEDRLRRKLGVKVAVKPLHDNRGRIEIEYFSLDELDRILNSIGTFK